MTNEIAVASGDYSFVATTPSQMEVAQRDLIRWCMERLEREKLELADLERTIAEAQKAGMKVVAWKRRLAMARAKMTFYRKVRAALKKGYYIVPPFDVQLFAIRTDKYRPTSKYTASYKGGNDFLQNAKLLPEGEGKFHSPFPTKDVLYWEGKDKEGRPIPKETWKPGWWDAVDFPFKLVKPEVIAAVGQALNDKLFDALGVLPKYRNPDPIVVGQIIPPHRPHDPLTFFVAWWMDPKGL